MRINYSSDFLWDNIEALLFIFVWSKDCLPFSSFYWIKWRVEYSFFDERPVIHGLYNWAALVWTISICKHNTLQFSHYQYPCRQESSFLYEQYYYFFIQFHHCQEMTGIQFNLTFPVHLHHQMSSHVGGINAFGLVCGKGDLFSTLKAQLKESNFLYQIYKSLHNELPQHYLLKHTAHWHRIIIQMHVGG